MDPALSVPQSAPSRGSVSYLTISHAVRQHLQEAGYHTVNDILSTSASDLSTELNISTFQAEDILQQCSNPPGPSRLASPGTENTDTELTSLPIRALPRESIQASTASNLVPQISLPRLSTRSKTLDALISQHIGGDFGGGRGDIDYSSVGTGAITPGMAVEISGPPGIGKTSVALGLVFDVHVGKKRSRRESSSNEKESGQVLIIDTEGAITPDRLHKAAEAVARTTSGMLPFEAGFILGGIHLVRIATQVQMIAFISLLDEWLSDHPKVNLVVIDSLSFHFRQPNLDITVRRRIMDLVKQQVGKATMVHRCAVILTTQMSTKVLSAEGKRVNFDTGEKAILMPQLGEMWQTAATLRVALFRGPDGNEIRYAHVGTTSNSDPNGAWACFDIDSDGLPMDVESAR